VDATIIIPCYNASSYIHDALGSALAQTGRTLEVIAVDDRSTDTTLDILRCWAAADRRVRVVQTPANGGPAAACNMAYDLAEGTWVTVLDSDDLYLPDRINRLIAIAEQRQADMIADNLLQQDFDTGTDLGLHFSDADMRHPGPLTLADMLNRDMPDLRGTSRLGFVQPMIRRDFLRRHGLKFSPEIRAGEDFLHYFECVAHGARFVLTPEANYIYRIRPNSITFRPSSTFYNSAANRRMMRLARRLGAGREVIAMLARRQKLIDLNCLAQAAADGEPLKALRYLHVTDRAALVRQARILGGALRRRLAAGQPATLHSPPHAPE
jgi:glycosyltransferase involved in cell wall biosynthesis